MDLNNVANRVAVSPEEGSPSVELDVIANCIMQILNLKYTLDTAYRSYVDRLSLPWRDSVYEHWKEHAEEERSMAYDLAMKLVAMGYDAPITYVNVPKVVAPTLEAFAQSLTEMEKQAILLYRTVINACGESDGLRVLMEDHLMTDSQHLDDLRRMFRPKESRSAAGDPGPYKAGDTAYRTTKD